MRHHQSFIIGKILLGHIFLGMIALTLIQFGIYPKSDPVIIYMNIIVGASFSIVCLCEYFGIVATFIFTIVLWMTPFHSLIQDYNVNWAIHHWKLMSVIVVAAIAFGVSRFHHAQGFLAALRNQFAVILLLFAVIEPLTGLNFDTIAVALSDNINMAIRSLL